MYYLDDLRDNQEFELGMADVTKESIIDFAEKYDPQAFHLDEKKATKMFGGLIASGLQTCCLCSKLAVETFLKKAACLASPGLEEIRFLKPVYAGDCLRGKMKVLSTKKSKSKPDRGTARFFMEMYNTKEERVLSMIAIIIMNTKPQYE